MTFPVSVELSFSCWESVAKMHIKFLCGQQISAPISGWRGHCGQRPVPSLLGLCSLFHVDGPVKQTHRVSDPETSYARESEACGIAKVSRKVPRMWFQRRVRTRIAELICLYNPLRAHSVVPRPCQRGL